MSNLKEAMDAVEAVEALETIAKRGARPVTALAPERERTLFESSAIQMAEVRLLTHRQLEKALEEQLRLTELELTGVRRVIAGDEALLVTHGSKL